MCVLHVVNRVFVVFAQGQVNVKNVFSVWLAAKQKEAHGVGAGPLDEVAQGHIAASAFGDFHLFAIAHHPHHGVQNVVWVALRHASIGGLQPGAHAGNGAVVVHTLNVDGSAVATLPFGQVVGDVRYKIGVSAVGFFHHAVFVVTVVGGLEPERAVLLVGFPRLFQFGHRRIDTSGAVQAGLKIVVVEAHREGLQVEVLLATQIGHCKLTNGVKIIQVARGGEFPVVRPDRPFCQKVVGNVRNVVAVIGQFGPARVAWLQPFGASLRAGGQGVNLHTRIVVIKLPIDLQALRRKQLANRIAQRGLTAMAHMQWPGWIG